MSDNFFYLKQINNTTFEKIWLVILEDSRTDQAWVWGWSVIQDKQLPA